MSRRREIREPELIDALGGIALQKLELTVWRIVRAGRDPLQGSSPQGRWDDGTFDVLYTSCEADGAKAEVHFHFSRGQPLFPSLMRFSLFEISVKLNNAFDLSSMAVLEKLGIDQSKYGTMTYAKKVEEYTASQKIGEAAYFLAADGILVPNARWKCSNVVLFTSRIAPSDISVRKNHGTTDLQEWARRRILAN